MRFACCRRHKSDAMCAVYAFMRKADDSRDDETMTIAAAARGDGGVAGWRGGVGGWSRRVG